METKEDYRQSVLIQCNTQEVFKALTQEIEEWWGPVDQPAEVPGDVFKIDFGGNSYWKFKVISSGDDHVLWECIASNQDHNVEGIDEEWLGSKLHWKFTRTQAGVTVTFMHQGLVPHGRCYDVCASAWDFYVTESLKNFLEQGQGNPNER